jgi:hypothetical protein
MGSAHQSKWVMVLRKSEYRKNKQAAYTACLFFLYSLDILI